MNQTIDIVIPPAVGGKAGVFPLKKEYKVFRCLSLDGQFDASYDYSLFALTINTEKAGFGSEKLAKPFERLILNNYGAVAVNAKIYIGDQDLTGDGTAVLDLNQALVAQAAAVNATGLPGGAVKNFPAGTFSTLKIIAQQDLARTANAGKVYFGVVKDNTKLYRAMAPGDEITIDAPAGRVRNLSDFWMNADNIGDGLVLEWC